MLAASRRCTARAAAHARSHVGNAPCPRSYRGCSSTEYGVPDVRQRRHAVDTGGNYVWLKCELRTADACSALPSVVFHSPAHLASTPKVLVSKVYLGLLHVFDRHVYRHREQITRRPDRRRHLCGTVGGGPLIPASAGTRSGSTKCTRDTSGCLVLSYFASQNLAATIRLVFATL